MLELTVLRQFLLINIVSLGFHSSLLLGRLHLVAGRLNVVNHVAAEAVFDTANWASMVVLNLVFLEKQVVTAFAWTFYHVRILVSNLLPLKLLAAIHLLGGEDRTQIRQRNWTLAALLGTDDRELLVFDTMLDPGMDARDMVDIAAYAECENLYIRFLKESFSADFAHILFGFMCFPHFVGLELLKEAFLHILLLLFLHYFLLFFSLFGVNLIFLVSLLSDNLLLSRPLLLFLHVKHVKDGFPLFKDFVVLLAPLHHELIVWHLWLCRPRLAPSSSEAWLEDFIFALLLR